MPVFWVLWIDERSVVGADDPATLGAALLTLLHGDRNDDTPQFMPDGFGVLEHEYPIELHSNDTQLIHWSTGELSVYHPEQGSDAAEIDALLDMFPGGG